MDPFFVGLLFGVALGCVISYTPKRKRLSDDKIKMISSAQKKVREIDELLGKVR